VPTNSTITITRLTRAIGAQIDGLDLRQPLSDEAHEILLGALHEHQVLFLRDQLLTDDEHVALAGRFGPVAEPFGTGMLERPFDDVEHPPAIDEWHTDVSFMPQPPALGGFGERLRSRFGGHSERAFSRSAHGSEADVLPWKR
jgi:taurine dioxygenase